MLQALYKEKLRNPPGTKFIYSDIGFIVLGEIVERITKISLDKFSSQTFSALKAKDSVFKDFQGLSFGVGGVYDHKNSVNPNESFSRIAKTEKFKGQQSYLGGSLEKNDWKAEAVLYGIVHDPTAFRMGGVAGHAGLFSTADDLARYCQMILNGGVLDGKRILSANTIARMTAPYVISETGATRGLGWDMNSSFSANRGDVFSARLVRSYGFYGNFLLD
jgi:CubicO group peptidase (beta-lactamase class C family)